jgi:ABC-2 type transport system ATP-binding protein
MSEMSAISFSNVHKQFKDGKRTIHALQGVDLEVSAGQIFGFLGPNGAGKTTALRILTTLLPFEEGEAYVAGISVRKAPQLVRMRIGYVSQKGGADIRATGWENLILQGRLYGLSKQEAILQAEIVVKNFTLTECIHRFVSSYSGGQKRRLDIALAMMHRPQVLFLDEPTNGLDPQSRSNLWSKILELKQEGVTVFLTSHYLDEVDALADTLAIMDHGKIVASGTPTHLKQQIAGDKVSVGFSKDVPSQAMALFAGGAPFLKEVASFGSELHLYVDKSPAALPQILRLLDQAEIPFETIQLSLPSLNDLFLKKTGRSLREEGVSP